MGKKPPVRKTGPTKIEKVLQDISEHLGIPHKTEYNVKRPGGWRYVLDLAIPLLKIDIEADGNYYHCNYCCTCKRPRKINEQCGLCKLPLRNTRQEATFVSDRNRDKFLERKGWLVLRFTETELKATPNKVKRRIKTAIRGRLKSMRRVEPRKVKKFLKKAKLTFGLTPT